MTTRSKANARLRNRLEDICKARGIKPFHLSQRIGKGQSTISEIINQNHQPYGDTLVKLCDELGCQVGDILYISPPA